MDDEALADYLLHVDIEDLAEMTPDELVRALRVAMAEYPDNAWRAELTRKLWTWLDVRLHDGAPLPVTWAR